MSKPKKPKPPFKIFALSSAKHLAESVCAELGTNLEPIREEKYADGELKVLPLTHIQGSDAIVFQALIEEPSHSLHNKLCEIFFFISSLRDQGTKEITVVTPYLCYARSDQRKEPIDSLTLKYVAELFESAGINKMIVIDVHNVSGFENAFRCQTVHLETHNLFCEYISKQITPDKLPIVISPDIGGIKRAQKFRQQLEAKLGIDIEFGFLEKFRTKGGLKGHKLFGPVKGRSVLVIDDMVSTGETVLRAVESCNNEGAASIKVLATHGLFVKNQDLLFNSPFIQEIIVTDSNPNLHGNQFETYKKLKVLSCASLIADNLREEFSWKSFYAAT